MYHASVTLTYSSGGWSFDPWRYWSGHGEAMCRSPKAAVRIAKQRARKMCAVPSYASAIEIEHRVGITRLQGV